MFGISPEPSGSEFETSINYMFREINCFCLQKSNFQSVYSPAPAMFSHALSVSQALP